MTFLKFVRDVSILSLSIRVLQTLIHQNYVSATKARDLLISRIVSGKEVSNALYFAY